MTHLPPPALRARLGAAALLAAALAAGPALAETLRCRSVNGNVTCAGSGAFSCQTVNGRTTCIGGDGAVVQQFGPSPRPSLPSMEPELEPDEPEAEEAGEPPGMRPLPFPGRRSMTLERRGPAGRWLHLERDGRRLRLRTESLAIDLD